jgi:hypothetical protein
LGLASKTSFACAAAALAILATGACQRRVTRPQGAAAVPATAAAIAPAPLRPALVPPRGKQITILYSSNLLGEYEPCG